MLAITLRGIGWPISSHPSARSWALIPSPSSVADLGGHGGHDLVHPLGDVVLVSSLSIIRTALCHGDTLTSPILDVDGLEPDAIVAFAEGSVMDGARMRENELAERAKGMSREELLALPAGR